jgi:hypothetical protein
VLKTKILTRLPLVVLSYCRYISGLELNSLVYIFIADLVVWQVLADPNASRFLRPVADVIYAKL